MWRKFGLAALAFVLLALSCIFLFLSRNHIGVAASPRVTPVEPPQATATRPPLTLAGGTLATDQYVPGANGSETLMHVVKKGESLPAIIRRFWPDTKFMTRAELQMAIRDANPALKGQFPKLGTVITIPGLEPQPIVEHPVTVPKAFAVHAIYLTGTMAGSENGLKLIQHWKEGGGNSVVFDVKDSDGSVNIPFADPLAPKHSPAIPNLPKFVRYLHQQNLHVIARIAIFRDELLVKNHPELAVRSRKTGEPWRENGKLVWTDPSLDEVQNYDLALARAAASAGVDEVQFDYVRFPAEGDQKDAKFAFETANPKWTRADVIADFLGRAQNELRNLHVLFSLDVFGVMAWQRPVDLSHTGQDIVRMAKLCDILSPMIYPSHFFGMDGYSDPGDAPEHFISESMDRFAKITEGSGVVIRPWLQAFGWRTRSYSTEYILTQVTTARSHGGDGFLFWNARNDYGKPLLAMATMRAAPDKYLQPEGPGAAPAAPAAAAPAISQLRLHGATPR